MERKKRREYTKVFKVEAVNLVIEQGYSLSEAARNLGIHPSLLRRWKNQIEQEGKNAFPGKGHMSPEEEEIRRLRRENRELRMEREILKKATAFFAKESK
jgi:transposase